MSKPYITNPYNSNTTSNWAKTCIKDGCMRDVAPGSDKHCVKHFNERLAKFGTKAVGNE
ncbi:MAG: hypothetical protein HRU28_08535 [Rhizobiales bacterium]|nr:hypothetical protein [Hyphomicrobiales bacterium]